MEWIIVYVCALVLLICAGVLWRSVDTEQPKQRTQRDRQGGALDAREAHYMTNFWNYDGSEQQDWEEQ